MKIKFNNHEKKQPNHNPRTHESNRPPMVDKKSFKTELLSKMYESPKIMLRKNLDVIEMAVQEQLESLISDYIAWRRQGKKRPDYIFNMVQDIAFVSVLPKIVKDNYDFVEQYGEEFSEIISSAVSELSRRQPSLSKSRDMIAIYSNIYEDLNEERIRKVFKLELPGVDWAEAMKLCIVSHGSPGHTMNNTLRAIYSSVKDLNSNNLVKLFKKLYGKHELGKVAVYILLERGYDKQRTAWINRDLYSLLTNIALAEIERHPKKEIVQLLKLYCDERRRSEYENAIRRRISMSSINKDDYPKINKAIKKLAKKSEMRRSFLDQVRVTK